MNATLAFVTLLAAAPAVPDKAQTVPFELLKSGHMAVQVKINGKGPFRLIFDTGAPITLVNNKVARAANLLKKQDRPALPLFGAGGEVLIKKLEVGGVAVEDVPGVVMDHPTVEAISRALGPIEGIVGLPFFGRFRTTIDYQKRTLTFVPNGHKPPDVLRSMMLALMAGGSDEVKVLAPAGVWGIVAMKETADDRDGVTIKTVLPGGPAARAGLKSGDRLLTIAGRWTDTLADLHAAAEKCQPGTAVPVRLRRADKEMELAVTPTAGL